MMKHGSVWLIAMILLTGCDVQPKSPPTARPPIHEPEGINDDPMEVSEAVPTVPAEFNAKVIKIIDGDTVDVLTDAKETIRVRLNGIDCPERGQPFGNNAKDFVSESIAGQMVRIATHGDDRYDRYDRTIGDIYHDGELINLSLVKAGLAWHYVKYAPDNTPQRGAEQQAKGQRVGLWLSAHGSIAPWEWRKMSKEERDEYR